MRQEFGNTIDYSRFRSTNALWNELRLNDPWSVGYVSSLIETYPFQSKEEWESFYYKSGRERNGHLAGLPEKERLLLNDFSLARTDPQAIKSLQGSLRSLNYRFGRTREQLGEKGALLHQHTSRQRLPVTLEECIEAVRFRTICETWNGIVVRERNTVRNLQKMFPLLSFRKADGRLDHAYAVDYEIYRQQELVGALQIKPQSYLSPTAYVEKARMANHRKNALYQEAFGPGVWEVIACQDGTILNVKVLENLKSLARR
jgi:hypothetical protein